MWDIVCTQCPFKYLGTRYGYAEPQSRVPRCTQTKGKSHLWITLCKRCQEPLYNLCIGTRDMSHLGYRDYQTLQNGE